jgi:CheY-like chemotaxis protein
MNDLAGRKSFSREVILVVDDDKMILTMVSEALQVFGYNVIEAENGFKAIDIFEKVHGRDRKDQGGQRKQSRVELAAVPDLVLLDVSTPDMRGGEVLNRIKEIEPDMKVLISGGANIDNEINEVMRQGCMGFIEKTLTVIELNEKIRSILGR